MTTHRIAGLLCAATLSTLTTAQGVHRFLLDTVGSVHQIIERGVLTTDGHIVMQLDGPEYDILWKGQLDGTPLWQRRVAPEIKIIHPLTNGEVLIMEAVTHTMGEINEHEMGGTVRLDVPLLVLDANGGIVRTTNLSHSYPVVSWGAFQAGQSFARTDDSGNLFVLVSWFADADLHTMVVKLDPVGELQWARTAKVDLPGGPIWPFAHNPLLGTPDNLGGYYISTAYDHYPLCASMHINSQGELSWFRSVVYTNAGSTIGMEQLVAASNGDLLMLGQIHVSGSAVGHFNYVLRYPINGSQVSADLHTPTTPIYMLERGAAENLLLLGGWGVRQLDNDGDMIDLLTFTSEQAQGSTHMFNPVGLDRVGDIVTMPGYMKSTHDVFGYQNWFPGAYTVDQTAMPLDDCLVGPGGTVTRHVVPDSMLEVADLGILLEAPILEITSVDSMAVETMTPIGTHDLCGFLTGVDEAAALNTPHVLHTLLTAGQPIQFAGEGPFLSQVLDAQGRLLSPGHLHRAGTTPAIATDGWPAGVHLVRMLASDGSWERTERVVLVH